MSKSNCLSRNVLQMSKSHINNICGTRNLLKLIRGRSRRLQLNGCSAVTQLARRVFLHKFHIIVPRARILSALRVVYLVVVYPLSVSARRPFRRHCSPPIRPFRRPSVTFNYSHRNKLSCETFHMKCRYEVKCKKIFRKSCMQKENISIDTITEVCIRPSLFVFST